MLTCIVCLWTWVCRSENNLRCHFSSAFLLFIWDTISYWPGTHQVGQAGWCVSSRDLPVCAYLETTGFTSIYRRDNRASFYMDPVDLSKTHMLVRQAFYQFGVSPTFQRFLKATCDLCEPFLSSWLWEKVELGDKALVLLSLTQASKSLGQVTRYLWVTGPPSISQGRSFYCLVTTHEPFYILA